MLAWCMHEQARLYLDFVRDNFPHYYQNARVLDVGGGNNKFYFHNCEFHANDVVPATDVTIVSKTSDLTFPDAYFDIIISSECFEHDMYYPESLKNIVRMLKPGGLFAFTCASTGRAEHGTRRCDANASLTTRLEGTDDADAWKDYYKNLTAEDVMTVIDCDDIFENYAFFYLPTDLYFYGIKKGDSVTPISELPMFTRYANTVCTHKK